MSVRRRKNTESSDSPLCFEDAFSNNKVRKIRKTLDLICFDSSDNENKNTNSFTRMEKLGLLTKSNCNNDSGMENQRKLKKVLDSDDTEQKENMNDARKIIKAKRHLRNTEGRFVTSEESPDVSFSPKNNKLSITTLPSPISPSENNSATISESFYSSQENLHPSTEGSVETSSKRHTFELENSITDVFVLKSASERDFLRINSVSVDKTPPFSKVTTRKKWKKFVSPMPDSGSPAWINKTEMTQTPSIKEKNTNAIRTSSKKFISKVKMPNFAAIHQKALAKIESIDDYKVRKENRAKMLLSGRKPGVSEKTEKGNRKELRFAPNTMDTVKSPTFIPLPSTPLPKKILNISVDSPKTRVPFTWDPSKIPKFDFYSEKVLKTPKFEKKAVPTKALNFQSKVNVFRKEEVKIIANKTKPEKNTLESRRFAIKGVRSNRRFDLLMKMREGK